MSFPPSSSMSEDCILSSELLTLIDGYIEGFAPAATPSSEAAAADVGSGAQKPAPVTHSGTKRAPKQLEISE